MNLRKEIFLKYPKDTYHTLTTPSVFKSVVAITHSVIIFIIILFILFQDNIYLDIVSFFLIGALQHRIYMIQHECTHYNLFQNKIPNIGIGSIFSYLIFFNWDYRNIHLNHHKSLGTDNDPDSHNYINYPAKTTFFLKDFLSHLLGFSAIKQFISQSISPNKVVKKHKNYEFFFLLLVQIILILIFSLINVYYYFFFWLLPLITITKTLSHVRNIAEHIQIGNSTNKYSRYRTIYPSIIEGFFLSPLNFNFHAEHHLFPKVCFHKLPTLHSLIKSNPSAFKSIDIQRGYLRFLFKCMISK